MLERWPPPDGPTAGRILRPSDGKEPRTVAFVQCAGSRDENHLPYCSAVCCAASLKQASYIRAHYPETAITIFYIDVRTPGRLEDFYTRVEPTPDCDWSRARWRKVEENPGTGDLLVTAEDTLCRPERDHAFRAGGAGHRHRTADRRTARRASSATSSASSARRRGRDSTPPAACAGPPTFPPPCRMPPARH